MDNQDDTAQAEKRMRRLRRQQARVRADEDTASNVADDDVMPDQPRRRFEQRRPIEDVEVVPEARVVHAEERKKRKLTIIQTTIDDTRSDHQAEHREEHVHQDIHKEERPAIRPVAKPVVAEQPKPVESHLPEVIASSPIVQPVVRAEPAVVPDSPKHVEVSRTNDETKAVKVNNVHKQTSEEPMSVRCYMCNVAISPEQILMYAEYQNYATRCVILCSNCDANIKQIPNQQLRTWDGKTFSFCHERAFIAQKNTRDNLLSVEIIFDRRDRLSPEVLYCHFCAFDMTYATKDGKVDWNALSLTKMILCQDGKSVAKGICYRCLDSEEVADIVKKDLVLTARVVLKE